MRLPLLVATTIVASAALAGGPKRMDSAADILARVSEQMGVPALVSAGFTQWSFAGTYDESVERGGFEPEPPATVRDTFAVDLEGNGAGWDSEGRRGDGTVRWRRFLYPSPDVFQRVDVPSRFASASRSGAYRAEQLRVARAIPQALLRELAARPQALRLLPPAERDGERLEHLRSTTAAGDAIDLLVDAKDRLRRVEFDVDVPFVGERRVAWVYGGWTRDRGLLIPRTLTILMGQEPLRVLALESVVWKRGGSIFVLPGGTPAPVERPGPAALPPAPLAPAAKAIADGVWLVGDVRPGINGYFVSQADGITAFEAPAGFLYPQIEIPPPDLARGRRSSEPSEAFVDLIKRTLPGQPIRRLVLSHAHADHAGGVRAFAAEGAEILVPSGASEPVRRFLAERFARAPDRFEQRRAQLKPSIREIAGREAIGQGAARFEVVRVAENPHSDAMVVLWFPETRLLLQGDLFYAEPLAQFPSASRVPIMKWFAGWLTEQKLEPALIYGTHSELPASREHLDKLAKAEEPAPEPIDPPRVDDAALVKRLVDMTKPEAGERAVLLFDPTYHPGIAQGLREALHARGVRTYAIAEETPGMIAGYADDEAEGRRREEDAVATLLPVFRASDIFYWLPLREYAGDMRWERLVAESRVRSVHFHWMLPFPGTRTPEAIQTSSRELERAALALDLDEHARRQRRLAAALVGRKLRITTPGGTDLVMDVARDEWFHFGDGDASRARAAAGRSVRDREMELPAGMFVFVPDAQTVTGTLVAPAIYQAGEAVKDARLSLQRGHVAEMSGTGADWIRERIGVIGPDGDKLAAVFLNTNMEREPDGVGIEIGSNWEVAEPRRRNRPARIRRMSMRLRDATLTADGRMLVRDGRILWDEVLKPGD